MATNRREEIANALTEAKFGTAISGYLALSYLIQTAYVYWGGKDTFGNVGLTTLASDIAGVIIATFLSILIWVRQPMWAAIVVVLWFATEMIMTISAIASGKQHINVNASQFGIAVVLLALAIGTIPALRGSWKLRLLRRSAEDPK